MLRIVPLITSCNSIWISWNAHLRRIGRRGARAAGAPGCGDMDTMTAKPIGSRGS